ncbi:unnamed protein product [Nezara viridula]|uniref:Uncharacterized protein n=1 Tax=Nezara viridula TaxID=85310 RepID=A0A9P0HP60_NEZVI|nr:unnamed protein product [Nezara viridula]
MAPQSSIFVKHRVKTAAKDYQDDILEPVIKPLNDTLFAGISLHRSLNLMKKRGLIGYHKAYGPQPHCPPTKAPLIDEYFPSHHPGHKKAGGEPLLFID